MAGELMIVRHEAHTGLTGAFSAATKIKGPVKVTGAKTFGPVTAGTDTVVGVAHHEVTAAMVTNGDKATVRIKGDVIPMTASAAIPAGTVVEAAAAGKVVTKSTGNTLGVAWTAATAADQEILIILL